MRSPGAKVVPGPRSRNSYSLYAWVREEYTAPRRTHYQPPDADVLYKYVRRFLRFKREWHTLDLGTLGNTARDVRHLEERFDDRHIMLHCTRCGGTLLEDIGWTCPGCDLIKGSRC